MDAKEIKIAPASIFKLKMQVVINGASIDMRIEKTGARAAMTADNMVPTTEMRVEAQAINTVTNVEIIETMRGTTAATTAKTA